MAATTYTKGEIVTLAFGELGIANYEFDIEPEEDIRALKRLDSLMAELQEGVTDLGYEQPAASGTSDSGDATGFDESLTETVIAILACRLAPSYGKTPGAETKRTATVGRSMIVRRYAQPSVGMELASRRPLGAGNHLQNYFPLSDAEAEMIEDEEA